MAAVELSPVKRLRRWLINGIFAISLLLFVSIGVMWLRASLSVTGFRILVPWSGRRGFGLILGGE